MTDGTPEKQRKLKRRENTTVTQVSRPHSHTYFFPRRQKCRHMPSPSTSTQETPIKGVAVSLLVWGELGGGGGGGGGYWFLQIVHQYRINIYK